MRFHEIVTEAPQWKTASLRETTTPVTDTPAFRAWFGSSKVVWPDGTPMVVYHGTRHDFDVFDLDRAMSESGAFFFSRDSDGRRGRDARAAGTYASGPGGNIMPVYLKMENPHVTGFTIPEPAEDSSDEELDTWIRKQRRFDKKFDDDRYKTNYFINAIHFAKRSGHDGVIIKHVTDDAHHSELSSQPSDIYIVFDPTQIKSAIGNRGTFDPASPNVMETVLDEGIDARQYKILRLIRGVRAGKLLVHVRIKDGTDFRFGIQPSAGEFLRSTEMWQSAEDEHGEGPELIFFADDFSWLKASTLATVRNQEASNLQAVFVRKNPSIVQDMGDGRVKTSSGQIIRYDMSEVADYDDPLYRDIPAGVEPGDWFTREAQDVVAVVDVADILAAMKD